MFCAAVGFCLRGFLCGQPTPAHSPQSLHEADALDIDVAHPIQDVTAEVIR
jgi:hypothetical protein